MEDEFEEFEEDEEGEFDEEEEMEEGEEDEGAEEWGTQNFLWATSAVLKVHASWIFVGPKRLGVCQVVCVGVETNSWMVTDLTVG